MKILLQGKIGLRRPSRASKVWSLGKHVTGCLGGLVCQKIDNLWQGTPHKVERMNDVDHYEKIEVYGEDCLPLAMRIVGFLNGCDVVSETSVPSSPSGTHAEMDKALDHLALVLDILAELVPSDRCDGLDNALAYYNERRPDARVQPLEGYVTKLVHFGPMDFAFIKAHATS